ncbi:MAG: MvaI/BcnI family restriction endonuclease, partial [FCB group bacterium]
MKSDKIIAEFKRIRNLEFVQSKRSNNTGIGKTFEDYLGVKENNKKDPDFENFEVKSQRFLTGSKITLFTKAPSHPDGANNYLKEKYGTPIKSGSKVLKLHTSFFGDRFNTYLKRYGFKIEFNSRSKKLFLIVKDLKSNMI